MNFWWTTNVKWNDASFIHTHRIQFCDPSHDFYQSLHSVNILLRDYNVQFYIENIIVFFYFHKFSFFSILFQLWSYWFGISGSWRISDFSFTNSLATSSLLRCDKIRNIVQPVSSIWMRLARASQQAHEPCQWNNYVN